MGIFGLGDKLKTGIRLVRQGQFEQAINFYNSLLAEEPANKEARIELARLYFKKDDYSSTKQMLLELLKYHPGNEEIKKILEITNFKKIASERYFNAHPCFSPDGKKIVFISARQDTNNDGRINNFDLCAVYLYDLTTGRETLLVNNAYYNSYPSFSPDGRKIIYLSARRDTNADGQINFEDNPGIYISDLETGQEKVVLPDTYRPKYPSFSPDGRKILYVAWRPGAARCGVYLFDLDTGLEKVISRDIYEHNFASFSPDGTKIVYTSWRSDTDGDGRMTFRDNTGIHLYNLVQEHEYQLVRDNFDNLFPVFSPDGRYIAFLSHRRDTNRDGKIDSLDNPGIYLYDLTTGKERMVVSDEHYNKFPTFSFDSKRLVYIGSWRGRMVEERGFFENKGIYSVEVGGKNEIQIVSDKYYGCREVVSSPVDSHIAYISWGKGTNRGLYLADIERLPSLAELRTVIEDNLSRT